MSDGVKNKPDCHFALKNYYVKKFRANEFSYKFANCRNLLGWRVGGVVQMLVILQNTPYFLVRITNF